MTHMECYNIYPSGVSGWKIPELDSGESRAVSDADGRGVTADPIPPKILHIRIATHSKAYE